MTPTRRELQPVIKALRNTPDVSKIKTELSEGYFMVSFHYFDEEFMFVAGSDGTTIGVMRCKKIRAMTSTADIHAWLVEVMYHRLKEREHQNRLP